MTTKTQATHPFGELLTQYRQRKPGLTQTRLAELAGYDQAILVRMAHGKKDLTGPSGRERVVRLIETLADQVALTTLDEANGLLLTAGMPPLFEKQPSEARLITRLMRTSTSHRVRRTNLPAPLSAFVGRAQEVTEVRRLLGETRLLTLTGAGGCGKTRLAQRVAADMLITYADGVWYAELASLTDPALIADAVARVFGLAASDRPTLDQLTDYLRDRHALIVLDNCEHLIDAVAAFAIALLQTCPRLSMLTTSREALNVEGETAWRVPPMQPDEAGRLFIERAHAARSDMTLSTDDPTVRHICTRLDGMPLAIELAAARLSAMSLNDIAARLDDRFNLLTGGRRSALPRHQTLRALIDWSYDALSEPEKLAFRRLGVFVGGWALEQAEEVVCDTAHDPSTVLSMLTQLVGKSLVVIEDTAGTTRYRMLETIRKYALEKLMERGEMYDTQLRHTESFARLAETAVPNMKGRGQHEWFDRMGYEQSNIEAALAWSFNADGSAVFGTRLVAALNYLWLNSSRYSKDRRRWVPVALTKMPSDLPPGLRAGVLLATWTTPTPLLTLNEWIGEALNCYREANDKSGEATALCIAGLGRFHANQSDEAARPLIERGIKLAREIGDDWTNRLGLYYLCYLAWNSFEWERAVAYGNELVALSREAGDAHRLLKVLDLLSDIAFSRSDFGRAATLAEEEIALARSLGDTSAEIACLWQMGDAKRHLGDLPGAIALLEDCLEFSQRVENPLQVAKTKTILAKALNDAGDEQRAETLLTDAGHRFLNPTTEPTPWSVSVVDGLGCVASARGSPRRAARLFGVADTLLNGFGGKRMPNENLDNAPHIANARTALGEEAFTAAYAEGRVMTLEQAIVYALPKMN